MKLCPLFESIELHWCDPRDPRERYLCSRTLEAANATLPREAIEASIHALTFLEFLPHSEAVNDRYIEQLRAMLPKE
jgi:hypothetical protein